ncbi:hypothetical protein WME98_03300 [Sorangium sp. So ce296]|uniref:hypothetical protein n=1 Tax=Sorangium sp. So ce296 TaxID=3133296 RepID=UPI003F5FABAF
MERGYWLGSCAAVLFALSRRRVAWSWPGGRYVSMSLHGGARGEAPRLGVVYGTAAQADGKR